MAHDIVVENGVAPIAFSGDTPWHGLGQSISPTAPLEEWAVAAGMNWDIHRSNVMAFDSATDDIITFPNRDILYRSDNQAPLSIVSGRYQIVQPIEVLEFFRSLIDTAGFTMSTAGVLFGGKKFWALANVGQGFKLTAKDVVDSYVLLATACDGSLSTTAKGTSICVVCNNTLEYAIHGDQGQNAIKIPHSMSFDSEVVKSEMGLARGSFELFANKVQTLADKEVSDREAIELIVRAVNNIPMGADIDEGVIESNNSGTTGQIFDLYKGAGMGATLSSRKGTAWGVVNAVTEFADHRRNTRSIDSKLDGAWFGTQANIKNRVFEFAELIAA